MFCHGFGRRRRRGVVRLGHVGGARSLADMLLDPAIDFCGDRSDDHAAAAFKGALMSAGGQSPIRIGVQFHHGKLQFLWGGLDGLLVLGAEPRGLGQRGVAGRAVDEDGGHGGRFWLDWVSDRKRLLESKGPRNGVPG